MDLVRSSSGIDQAIPWKLVEAAELNRGQNFESPDYKPLFNNLSPHEVNTF